MHRFQQTLDELKSNLRDIKAERAALDAQEEVIRSTIEGLERLIALESGVTTKTINKPSVGLTCTACGGPRSLGSASLCGKCYSARADKRRAERSIVKESNTTPPKTSKKGRPKTERSKIASGIAFVRKGQTIGSAAKTIGVSRSTLGAAIRAKDQSRWPAGQIETPNDCGMCVTRIIDGKLMLAASPDCPTHGLGLGEAQEGRDRKGDSTAIS